MAKILIVDDSNELLEVLQYFLEDAGHTVDIILSGAILNERLDSFKPDLIILDVLLQKENGREICKTLKNNPSTKNIPIILMSASDKSLENFRECGADDVLSKPFDLMDIISKIKDVLNLAAVLITPSMLSVLAAYIF